jgi:hypothetical protein
MFLEVDSIIFPDSCEVIQVASQHFVYPIFKCGRSSLTNSMYSKGWKFVSEDKIKTIQEPFTVFLRDPWDRFLSGVNTYLQHLENEGNSLDTHTVLYFVNRYLFLNRHYAPQFFWLLNLAKFVGIDAQVSLRNLADISTLVDMNHRARVAPITDELKNRIESFDWSKLELYLFLDQILLDHVGQTISIRNLLLYIKNNQPELYQLVFEKSADIVNVLP